MKRYDISAPGGCHEIDECPDGEWVRFVDVVAARLEELKAGKAGDPCPLCDGSGVVPPANVSRDVLLCGACTAGRPEDCSGWCGRSAKPAVEVDSDGVEHQWEPCHAALVAQVAELTRERDVAEVHERELRALQLEHESEVTRLTEALAAAEARVAGTCLQCQQRADAAEARVRELEAEVERLTNKPLPPLFEEDTE